MDQADRPLPLQCPDHRVYDIGVLSEDSKARKIGYCYQCLFENRQDATLLQNLKSVPEYLADKSNFYEKCLPRAQKANELPAEYAKELSKKGERLEKLSKYIDEEKAKVIKRFGDLERIVIQIIHEKKNGCLELLDKEIKGLSDAYRKYEKLLMMRWPGEADIGNIYPEINTLKRRMLEIQSMDQLRAFLSGIEEDIQIQKLYFSEEDITSQIKNGANELIDILSIPERALPKIQSQILDSENLENLMKDLMKGFSQEKVQVQNSIASRIKLLTSESEIITCEQLKTLRGWLPQSATCDLKLLFRGSVDGMSSQKFHEKCDNKGATITLIKCRFNGAPGSSILGGFMDQSCHSDNKWSSSREAFLFSLAEQSHNSVKCPIQKPENAFYGAPQYGPVFGAGNDLYIHQELMSGTIVPKSYYNSTSLQNGHGNNFKVEEIEVFQVQ